MITPILAKVVAGTFFKSVKMALRKASWASETGGLAVIRATVAWMIFKLTGGDRAF